MIDQPAVDLFGRARVITAVPGLHVINRNAGTGGNDSSQGGIGVTEDQHTIRAGSGKNLLGLRKNLSQLLGERTAGLESHVRQAQAKFFEKVGGKSRVIVLPGVNEAMILTANGLIQQRDDPAEPDDLRASAKDGEDFH
jgi:hypothetical protein